MLHGTLGLIFSFLPSKLACSGLDLWVDNDGVLPWCLLKRLRFARFDTFYLMAGGAVGPLLICVLVSQLLEAHRLPQQFQTDLGRPHFLPSIAKWPAGKHGLASQWNHRSACLVSCCGSIEPWVGTAANVSLQLHYETCELCQSTSKVQA